MPKRYINSNEMQIKKRIAAMMGRLSLFVVWFSEELVDIEYLLLNYTFSSSLGASQSSLKPLHNSGCLLLESHLSFDLSNVLSYNGI